MHNKRLFVFVVIFCVLTSLIAVTTFRKHDLQTSEELVATTTTSPVQMSINNKRYEVKEFAIIMGAKKFSSKQINDHKQLYAGYVNKRNEIDTALQTVDKANGNISYSQFRGLKLAETFTRNGAILHELYFENIGAGATMGKATEEIIVKHFGSVAAFKEDLMATALSARGWALTCYNLDDKRMQNYLLDAHNEKVPVLTIPLLVIDTYEHAYMIDFGINRKEYLAILWDNINWDVIEKRVKMFT